MIFRAAVALLIPFLLPSCAAVHCRECPPEAGTKATMNRAALEAIQQLGSDGDWLVVRKYHHTDNFIATVRNAPLSHAAVLDLKNQRVVEATAMGTHVTPLAELIADSHRLLLIRPKWANPANREAAVERATALVGKKYDFLGLLGGNVKDRYYCSELALTIYQPFQKRDDIIPHPVAPDQLYFYGRILYDTGAL